jgi:MFS family permease
VTLISRERQAQLQRSLIVSFISQGFIASAIIPRVPDVIHQLNISFVTWGLVSGLSAVGAALGLASANSLLHRWGGKHVALVSFVFVVLAQSSLGFLTSVVAYFLINLSIAFAMSTFNISINSQAVVLQTVTGRVILGRFHASWSIGSASSAAISGFLAPLLPLWLHLSAFALTGGIVWLIFGTQLLNREEGFTADEGASEKPPSWLLTPKRVYLLGVGLAVGVFPEAAMWDWSNIYGREYLGYGPAMAAIPYSVFAMCMIVGRFSIDLFGKRVPMYVQAAVGATLGSLALIASTIFGPTLTADGSLSGLIAISALWAVAGLGAAPVVPTFLASATLVSGMSTAQAMARISILEMALIIGIKFGMGNVAEASGIGTAYWIPISAWIIAAGIALWAYGLHRKIAASPA